EALSGALIEARRQERAMADAVRSRAATDDKAHPHRIVIVGGGAGGLELATRLGDKLGHRGQAEVTLIDKARAHLWKPLLHEIAAGSMDLGHHELDYLAQAHWHHFRLPSCRMASSLPTGASSMRSSWSGRPASRRRNTMPSCRPAPRPRINSRRISQNSCRANSPVSRWRRGTIATSAHWYPPANTAPTAA